MVRMFFRAIWPRLTNQLCRLQEPCAQRLNYIGHMQRSYGSHRYLPIWRRPFNPERCDNWMERQFRDMDRTIGECMGPVRRPWWAREPAYVKTSAKELDVKYDATVFEIKLDVSQFNPEELNLKIMGNRLLITGRHTEKPDEHGSISREFSRFVPVPEDVDIESFESLLTDDGFLMIKGSVKEMEDVKAKTINIERGSS